MRFPTRLLAHLLLAILAVWLTSNSASAATETILYGFHPFIHGQSPSGGLISDTAGNLYGTTYYGGAYAFGTVFELTPTSSGGWTETVLYSFRGTIGGGSDGWNPTGSLVFEAAGNLCGATTWGGTAGVGTVFKLTRSSSGTWTERVIWNFQQTSSRDGFNPQGGLVFDQAGNLYGTTRFGGGYSQVECSFDGGCGTVFRLSPRSHGQWKETVLYVFQGKKDGAYPNDSLAIDLSGNLYGTNTGLTGHGVVFELKPSPATPWTEVTLYSFTGGADGAYPSGGLIFDLSGNLYGATAGGGSSTACYFSDPCGTVFKLSAMGGDQWSERVLYSFNGIDGQSPQGNLTFDKAGNLYGTTLFGGTSTISAGTAFKLTPSSGGGWTETVVWNFTGASDGEYPAYGVTVDPAGALLGATGSLFFSQSGNGTVFQLTSSSSGDWVETTLTNFPDADGFLPQTNLVADAAGNLYGAASQGGAHGFGTVFKLTHSPDGSWKESVLYNFPKGTTAGPYSFSDPSTLIFDNAGNLFGETAYGGTKRAGTVFELSPSAGGGWVEKDIFTFTGRKTGQNPFGGLVFDQAGNLYGTTGRGGNPAACSTGCGTVFELSPGMGGQWTEAVLYEFQGGSDGAGPAARLVFDGSGNLFGTTQSGGAQTSLCNSGCGTVFELSGKSGGTWTQTVLHRFTNDHGDGAVPMAGLIFDGTGNLYGTTLTGGKHDESCGFSGCGTIFALAPSSSGVWSESVIHAFDIFDGVGAIGGLLIDPQGNLYGTTEGGSGGTWGNVFQLSPHSGGGWSETVLYQFQSVGTGDGYFPAAGLILDQSGNLYGTTAGGGNGNSGTVFQIRP